MRKYTSSSRKGFTLISTLLLISLLVALIGLVGISVSISQRTASAEADLLDAQQSALYGLQIALGELQRTAGPDQRITANASIFEDNFNVIETQKPWVGVWKSGTGSRDKVAEDVNDEFAYDPAMPDSREFLGWLVSTTNANGELELPATINSVATPLADTQDAIDIVSFFTEGEPQTQFDAEKVRIDSLQRGDRYFAFAVEDEASKADLSWQEGVSLDSTDSSEQEWSQSSRLAAAPGPDYSLIFEDLEEGNISGPVSIAEGQNIDLIEDIDLVRDLADLHTLFNSDVDDWLNEHRNHVTWGSRGVMADVKFGGLRRDLSLAFEMDGKQDDLNSITRFNSQVGEFVGDGDRLSAPATALTMPAPERYLFRDINNNSTPTLQYSGGANTESNTPFNQDIQIRNLVANETSAPSVIRGPNWWLLRDYANLYKELDSEFALKTRTYFPNTSATGTTNSSRRNYGFQGLFGANSRTTTRDFEFALGSNSNVFNGNRYIYKPAKGSYAPVFLGGVTLYSALAKSDGSNNNLALGVDPLFFLWNPYNRRLKAEKFAIIVDNYPGVITFWVNGQIHGPARINGYFFGRNQPWISYLLSDLDMAPGEILVVSPTSNRSSNATDTRDELEAGTNTDNESGLILTNIPTEIIPAPTSGSRWSYDTIALNPDDEVGYLLSARPNGVSADAGNSNDFDVNTYLPDKDIQPNEVTVFIDDHVQNLRSVITQGTTPSEYYDPELDAPTAPLAKTTRAGDMIDTKTFFGASAYLTLPANPGGDWAENVGRSVEIFSHFNPAPLAAHDIRNRPNLNQSYSSISRIGDLNTFLQALGVAFPAGSGEEGNGFWGRSYENGSTSVPMSYIPDRPLISLVELTYANMSYGSHQPMHALGNSYANIHVPRNSPYGFYQGRDIETAHDSSWLLNDAIFDRYYLSGLAPDFEFNDQGYSEIGSLSETIKTFFGEDTFDARANPVLKPYIPEGVTADDIISELSTDDGYRKLGAYSMIHGQFNVNSTSVDAWEALIRANRNITVKNADGDTENSTGTPFPNSKAPIETSGAEDFWSGFSRLSDDSVTLLAEEIVNQVKLRGPFMSISDFVNRRVGSTTSPDTRDMGALQAAIEAAGINEVARNSAGGVTPDYNQTDLGSHFPDPGETGTRQTTTGIPGEITQANLLLPLAPRLSARSDTFRIRSYGELRSNTDIISKVACEAIAQRVPEYFDKEGNQPWDEEIEPVTYSTTDTLSDLNKRFGRRFKIVQFRWLSPNEI